MTKPVIEVKNLSKQYTIGEKALYGNLREEIVQILKAPFKRLRSRSQSHSSNTIWALKDVSFEVQEGEVLGIIGRNGAGKSTLLKILSRITEPTEGKVRMRGRVGSLLEVGTGFHPELTGRENIFLNGALLGMRREEIKKKFDEIVDFAEIEKFLDTPVKRYSSGMYVRLAFAVAAHLETEILLVDEVLAVGDMVFQKKCLGKIGEVAKRGRTVLFVSHNVAAVQALCGLGVLLENGRVDQIGSIGEVVDVYMHKTYKQAERTSNVFPVFNHSYGIGITDCVVRLNQDSNGKLGLEVELTVVSTRHLRNIGVGLALTSIDGIKVSVLGPSITNYVIEGINGSCQCIFHCQEIDRYLAGGDYVLSVWLSKPRVDYLVRVEQAALVVIPPKDKFLSGVNFEARYHGIVPLPLKFLIQKKL